MDYLKIEDMAKLWEISPRRLQTLCAQGRIEGATRFGRAWMIPVQASRPVDGRSKAGRAKAAELLMQAALDAGGRDNISVVVLQDKEGAR